MGLSRMGPVLRHARENRYAVPAFNVCNLEYAQVVIHTANELNSPVIVALHPVEIEYGGLVQMAGIVQSLAREASVPVVLYLDHGERLEDIVRCITHGFTSVMIDASRLHFVDNIAATCEAVRFAHAAGVDVEAELGIVGGAEGDRYATQTMVENELTDPGQAAEFARETGVDSLAVAIGTSHGLYQKPPHIDLAQLDAIRSTVKIPLVLHGGSGIEDAVIRQAIQHGIAKINIATELKYAFHQGLLKAVMGNPAEFDPRMVFPSAIQAAKNLITRKIKLFGSENRA